MLSTSNFIDDLRLGCKPKDRWRMGLELESFVADSKTGQALPYEGDKSIREILCRFADRYGWDIISESNNPVALTKDGETFSIEPGGQLEYSGAPYDTLAGLESALTTFYKNLTSIIDEMDLTLIFAGFPKSWRREDMHWMPKTRYEIMQRYMPGKGTLGLDMMLRTCGTQINLDYESEHDMVRKFRVALGLQPLIIALMANASFKEGRPVGYASYRAHIWTQTDPDRCGIPDFVFSPAMGFSRYVDYALDVPMYFVRRQGRYIDVAGRSFRDFMNGRLPELPGEMPTMTDWQDHLTTLFPDVRLKRYLELRGADSQSLDMVMAMAAFWKGILYTPKALGKALDDIAKWTTEHHIRFREEAAMNGLVGVAPEGQDIWVLAASYIGLASEGLEASEQCYLTPFRQKIELCAAKQKTAI